MLKYCVKCKVDLECVKTGLVLRWGVGHCYCADKFKCLKCGNEIFITAPQSFFQTDTAPANTIQMD